MAERYAGVITFLPGATALRMETLISEPIETALREIPEIKELTSSSKAGQSVVDIELYDSVADSETDNVWSEVRDVLSDTVPALPAGAVEPELQIRQPIASTLIVAINWLHDSPQQLGIMSRIAETLRISLANTPGTEVAETWGEVEEEIRVAIDPYKMVASGMSAERVASAIAGADTKVPAGRLRSRRQRYAGGGSGRPAICRAHRPGPTFYWHRKPSPARFRHCNREQNSLGPAAQLGIPGRPAYDFCQRQDAAGAAN